MSALLELAERCEKADASEQREMLEWAWQEIHGWPVAQSRRDDAARFIRMLDAAAYESAALMLVPEGWVWFVKAEWDDAPGGKRAYFAEARAAWMVGRITEAATPALALCAAALRARAA